MRGAQAVPIFVVRGANLRRVRAHQSTGKRRNRHLPSGFETALPPVQQRRWVERKVRLKSSLRNRAQRGQCGGGSGMA